jgi:hypothetical protein
MLHRVYGVHFGTFLFRFLFNKYKITTQESPVGRQEGRCLSLTNGLIIIAWLVV